MNIIWENTRPLFFKVLVIWCGFISGSAGPTVRSSTSVLLSCPPDMIKCVAEGRCLPEKLLCNGFRDCRDGSDEDHCSGRTRVLNET